MRIRTFVELSDHIEIDVPLADIVAALNNDAEIEDRNGKLGAINIAYGMIKRTKDTDITGMPEKQRKVIYDGLIEQAERFK